MLKWLEMWGNLSMIQNTKNTFPSSQLVDSWLKLFREFFSDLAEVKNDDPRFNRALKLASRCFNDIEQLRDPSSCAPAKKRYL